MAAEFYKSFEPASCPCYWLGADGTFWMNDAARHVQGIWSNEEAIEKLLMVFSQQVIDTKNAGAHNLPLLTDALRLQGLVVIPHPEGVFATASEDAAPPVSAFSSQMREPLANIFATLPLLAKKLEGGDLRYAEEIQASCYSLLRLTENLETAGKLERQSFEVCTIDMTALIESLCICVEAVCQEKGISIQRKLPSHPLLVKADAKIVSVAFLNVLRNSLQYTRDNNKIMVRLSQTGRRAVLTIEDKGLGIKPENLAHIFESYFSADPYGDSPERPGLGLGLPITRDAMRKLGGTVTAESTFGEGTCVTLSLPFTEKGEEVLNSTPAEYLLNRYSSLYVQLSGFCRVPGF